MKHFECIIKRIIILYLRNKIVTTANPFDIKEKHHLILHFTPHVFSSTQEVNWLQEIKKEKTISSTYEKIVCFRTMRHPIREIRTTFASVFPCKRKYSSFCLFQYSIRSTV